MTRIILNGFSGKLSKAIQAVVNEKSECEIVAGIDVSIDNSVAFPTFDNVNDCQIDADVIIDCSVAKVVDGVLDYAEKRKIPILVCTTGLSPATMEHLKKASESIGVFKSANMSIGINLIASMLEKISGMLDNADFDIEIIEKHHNQKIDAPSGTALLLADAVNDSLDNQFEYVYDRTENTKKRERNELGIHSIRGGTIVGEHSVIFAGKDEVIEIKHSAYSKDVFAVGAVKAAMFLHGKTKGLYSMRDLTNLL